MIAGNQNLAFRRVFETVLPHETGSDAIAPGQLFNARFRPPAPRLRFVSRHQTRTAEASQIGRMAFAGGCKESLSWCGRAVVAQDSEQCIDKCPFAVAAGAIKEEQRMLADVAGQAVARDPAQIRDQLKVTIGDTVEKLEPRFRKALSFSVAE
jgi:hypothetical protein